MKKTGYLLLLVLVLVSVVQLALQHPQLPERVASHFGSGGEPNGFSSKGTYTLLMLLLQLGTPLFFIGLSTLTRRIPTSLINIPNREYWLHPDRARKTRQEVETSLIWLCVIVQMFMICLVQLMYDANLAGAGLWMPGFALLMAVFMLAISGFVIALSLRYSKQRIAAEKSENPRQ